MSLGEDAQTAGTCSAMAFSCRSCGWQLAPYEWPGYISRWRNDTGEWWQENLCTFCYIDELTARLIYVEGQWGLLRRQLPPGPPEHFLVLDDDDLDEDDDPWQAHRPEYSDGW